VLEAHRLQIFNQCGVEKLDHSRSAAARLKREREQADARETAPKREDEYQRQRQRLAKPLAVDHSVMQTVSAKIEYELRRQREKQPKITAMLQHARQDLLDAQQKLASAPRSSSTVAATADGGATAVLTEEWRIVCCPESCPYGDGAYLNRDYSAGAGFIRKANAARHGGRNAVPECMQRGKK
jgi:hypothetical protein